MCNKFKMEIDMVKFESELREMTEKIYMIKLDDPNWFKKLRTDRDFMEMLPYKDEKFI